MIPSGINWSSMETKLDIMSGRNMAMFQAAAYNDAVILLSRVDQDVEPEVAQAMGLPDGSSVMRDVMRSCWKSSGEELRICMIVSLIAKSRRDSVCSFLFEWASYLAEESAAKDYNLRLIERFKTSFESVSSGKTVEPCTDTENEACFYLNAMNLTRGEMWKELKAIKACLLASRFISGKDDGGDLWQVLQESLDITGRRIYPMAEMTDKFMSLLLKHFPEPPPLP